MNKKQAFTLIELLTVITILCLLAAILFPVFSSAKRQALMTQSTSNLKQIGYAWQLYNSDYDENTMPFAIFDDSTNTSIFWWAKYQSGVLDYSQGILSLYTKSKAINQDPLFNNHIMDWIGFNGYGYNYFYLSPQLPTIALAYKGVGLEEISYPSSTIAFGTTALMNQNQVIGNPYFVPSSFGNPTFQARNGAKGLIMWTDIHITTMTPSYANKDNVGYCNTNNDLNSDQFFKLN